ncbi:hypothetical protein D9M69_657970 [compost metagenome]
MQLCDSARQAGNFREGLFFQVLNRPGEDDLAGVQPNGLFKAGGDVFYVYRQKYLHAGHPLNDLFQFLPALRI